MLGRFGFVPGVDHDEVVEDAAEAGVGGGDAGAAPLLHELRPILDGLDTSPAPTRGLGCATATLGQAASSEELAAQGLTSKELGRRLFLSPRTVGSHLYPIFPKLGIAAHGELAAALDDSRRD